MLVIANAGLDNIRFGDTRSAVHDRIDSPFKSFRKDEDQSLTDAYDALGLHIYYDKKERVEFIEIFEPATAYCVHVSLLGRPLKMVEADLRDLGFQFAVTDVGAKCDSLGVALTSSEGIVEGVGLYPPGYYAEE